MSEITTCARLEIFLTNTCTRNMIYKFREVTRGNTHLAEPKLLRRTLLYVDDQSTGLDDVAAAAAAAAVMLVVAAVALVGQRRRRVTW